MDFQPRCSRHLNQPIAFLEVLAIGLGSEKSTDVNVRWDMDQWICYGYIYFGDYNGHIVL